MAALAEESTPSGATDVASVGSAPARDDGLLNGSPFVDLTSFVDAADLETLDQYLKDQGIGPYFEQQVQPGTLQLGRYPSPTRNSTPPPSPTTCSTPKAACACFRPTV